VVSRWSDLASGCHLGLVIDMNRKILLVLKVCFIVMAAFGALTYISYIRPKNTSERFQLSSQELVQLEEKVVKERDGDAAFRIALYYQNTKRDRVSAERWLRRADELGCREAKETLSHQRDLEH